MPRFIIRPPPRSKKHERLVKRLVKELGSSSGEPQPLILEQEVPATGSRHVYVIWDHWKEVPDEERADVIIEAYTQAEGKSYAENVTIASGVTAREALALGLLPWKLVIARGRHEDAPTMKEHEKALAAEIRNTLLGSGAKEPRYARLEDAEESKQRLEKALPGSRWQVVQEIQSDE